MNLKQKYKAQRKWRQATKNYGFWVYPHAYYNEMITQIIKNRK